MSPGYAPAEPETFVPVGPTKMVESWASLKTVDMASKLELCRSFQRHALILL